VDDDEEAADDWMYDPASGVNIMSPFVMID
jgi:hypothetical protein